MTVQTERSKAIYIANGKTTTFTIPFYFFNHEIAVYKNVDETPFKEGKDYDVSGAGQPAGGEVIFKVAPAANTKITIKRQVPLTQLTTFIEGESFPAVDYERSLDRIIMALQSIKDTVSRCISLPDGADKTPEEIYKLILELDSNFAIIKQVPALADKILEYYQNIMGVLQNYITKDEINTKLGAYYTKNEVNTLINSNKTLKISDLTANVSNITADETYAEFPYKLDIPVSSAKSTQAPTVVFDPSSALSGNFAPVSTALNGYVRIYLKEVPDTEIITIPAIILH